jgi:segregation and condensation protein A
MAFDIHLDNFEGPLDLLLHLIRGNEMDIYDIPIAEITAQYLAILDAMQDLNLDVAGEFLLMAATLLHIKSRLLLPVSDDEGIEEEEEDPRAELVRRLLEYQKYKDAAVNLQGLPQLEREVFARKFSAPELAEAENSELEAVGLFELVEAFRSLLQQAPEPFVHQVETERLSVSDRINAILTLLNDRENLAFMEIFSARPDRHEVVVSFLAILELVKMRLVRLLQNARFGSIWLYPAVPGEEAAAAPIDEEHLGYL